MSSSHASHNASGGEGEGKKRGNSPDERETSKKVRSSSSKGKPHERHHHGELVATEEPPLGRAKSQDDNDEAVTNDRSSPTSGGHEELTHAGEDSESPQQQRQRGQVWDLESALLYLVQIGNHNESHLPPEPMKDDALQSNSNPQDSHTETDALGESHKETTSEPSNNHKETTNTNTVVREYLTHEEDSWITFRAAHAGDATTIAQWYRRQRPEEEQPPKHRRQEPHPQRRKKKASNPGHHRNSPTEHPATTEEDHTAEAYLEDPEIDKQPSRRRRASSADDEIGSDSYRQHSHSQSSDDHAHEVVGGVAAAGVEDHDESRLEHWLAEGLGDENTCPFVHGLLAYVHRSPTTTTLGAAKKCDDEELAPNHDPTVASLPPTPHNNNTLGPSDSYEDSSGTILAAVVLMCLTWTEGKRNLRIEWMSFDASVVRTRDEGLALREKVWLRLHVLSSMTACYSIYVDDKVLEAAQPPAAAAAAATAASEDRGDEEPLEGGTDQHSPTGLAAVEPSAE